MKIILISIFIIFGLYIQSCEDIINTESNVDKHLLQKKFNSSDSLGLLDISELNFGNVKMRAVSHGWVRIVNNSDKTIKIYSLRSKNGTGLFSYTYPQGMPFEIAPGENTEITEKIRAKFIADAFNTDWFYDTLIINNNPDFYISVKAKVWY